MPALAIQQPDGLDVLESRAKELKASSFTVIPEHPQLRGIKLGALDLFRFDSPELTPSPPGLAGVHQRSNASLAVALVQSFLASPRCPPAFSDLSVSSDESSAPTDASTLPSLPSSLVAPNPLPPTLVTALEQTRWPGRCQVSPDPVNEGVRWFLDGAHTVESLQCCGEWFEEASLQRCAVRFLRVRRACLTRIRAHSSDASVRALIFNCTSGRSGLSLLGTLLSSLSSQPFQHVIFCTNTTYSTGASSGGASLLPVLSCCPPYQR